MEQTTQTQRLNLPALPLHARGWQRAARRGAGRVHLRVQPLPSQRWRRRLVATAVGKERVS